MPVHRLLILGLEPGGACGGSARPVRGQFAIVWVQEMPAGFYMPVRLNLTGAALPALTCLADPADPLNAGDVAGTAGRPDGGGVPGMHGRDAARQGTPDPCLDAPGLAA